MIDLHMHTRYSDGTDTLKEILQRAEDAGLDLISVTDHNTCDAYEEMETLDVSAFYRGRIIVGCEFTTSFEDRLIEVLGYGFDYHKVNQYLKAYYRPEAVKHRTDTLYNRLMKKIEDCGLEYHADHFLVEAAKDGFFELGVYEELMRYPENRDRLPEDVWDSFSIFFRKGLTNARSKLFIHHAAFRPPLEAITDLVHQAGGIVFLAHPFQYQFSDTEDYLDRIFDRHDLDGVECYYTTFTDKQTAYLLDYAGRRRLLISGGSDYHGTNKKQHELGIGRGNLQIDSRITDNWPIHFYHT